MKKILVPTDYSETADNALNYACHMAQEENAEIILMHVFHFPYPITDSAIPMVSYVEIEKAEHLRMKKLKEKLEKLFSGKIKITTHVMAGLVGDEVNSWCKEHSIHLVVMGITGGGALKEFFIGSNALSVAKNCGTDVLIVPRKAKYKPVKKIALASDLENIDVNKISHTLKHYCNLFDAKLEIVNVRDAFSMVSEEMIDNKKKIRKAFSNIEHTIEQPWHENVHEAVENHIKKGKSDWLAVVHKEYNFFRNLFHASVSKELAFHSEVPILSINPMKHK